MVLSQVVLVLVLQSSFGLFSTLSILTIKKQLNSFSDINTSPRILPINILWHCKFLVSAFWLLDASAHSFISDPHTKKLSLMKQNLKLKLLPRQLNKAS